MEVNASPFPLLNPYRVYRAEIGKLNPFSCFWGQLSACFVNGNTDWQSWPLWLTIDQNVLPAFYLQFPWSDIYCSGASYGKGICQGKMHRLNNCVYKGKIRFVCILKGKNLYKITSVGEQRDSVAWSKQNGRKREPTQHVYTNYLESMDQQLYSWSASLFLSPNKHKHCHWAILQSMPRPWIGLSLLSQQIIIAQICNLGFFIFSVSPNEANSIISLQNNLHIQ